MLVAPGGRDQPAVGLRSRPHRLGPPGAVHPAGAVVRDRRRSVSASGLGHAQLDQGRLGREFETVADDQASGIFGADARHLYNKLDGRHTLREVAERYDNEEQRDLFLRVTYLLTETGLVAGK